MLSKHFAKHELACRHCAELPSNGMSKALMGGLEQLRELICRPIYVTSGYRCQEHNKSVGGQPNSQHVQGCAADIYVEGVGVYELGVMCKRIFDGVGEYYEQGFVHVDMRDDGKNPGKYTWDDQW